MKVLKISDGKCTFSIDGTSYKSICEINKQDLLKILDYIYKNDNYEIDMITSETVIYNEVEKIIYSSILLKIKDFIENVQHLKSEIEDEFKIAKEKYLNN